MRILFGIFCLFLVSCQNKPNVKFIKNEVWSAQEINGEISKKEMVLLEAFDYNRKGIEIRHFIYDGDGNLAGKEISEIDGANKLPNRIQYLSADDVLITYYNLVYNDKDQKTSKTAYDAKTNEKLRTENYYYDDHSNMVKKEILDGQNNLQRTYEYEYDEFGNEIKNIAKDFDGNIRVVEEITITKYNTENMWLENYSLRNGEPFNIKKRTVVYN